MLTSSTLMCQLLLVALWSTGLLAHGVEEDVNVDAAFNSEDGLYLFKGDSYVLIQNVEETASSSITSLGLPKGATVLAVDAISKDNPTSKIFYRDADGVYHHGDYNNAFINDDVDAVAERLGTLYFFKGCEHAQLWPDYNFWLRPTRNAEPLPCDIDAAWTEGQSLIALKDDQIWTWGRDGITGPTPFKDRYTLHSWKLIRYFRLRL